ncbi:MAG: chemotaxis protein CheX [Syntrophaceae bacterium]|nr:chemotaxis protein CheX [Syntrophaceae bacterium]
MDVKYINPFLSGTLEVLKKMAAIDAVPGKPHVKTDESAFGDVSGIIGITGDALGSLALSFSEACICRVVANMLGERFDGVTQEIIDATGELTNMISGASRTQMEKMGMRVYAAIPTVVHGKRHTISHILKAPSIVIPFSTAAGPFFVDVCIRTTEQGERDAVHYGVANVQTPVGPAPAAPPAGPKRAPAAAPGEAVPVIDIRPAAQGGPGRPVDLNEVKEGAAGKLETLRARLRELTAKRNAVQGELNGKPFMELARRKRLKSELTFYDGQIKKLKLDILGLEMVARMSQEDLDNPKITAHYQNYDTRKKR